MQEHSLSFGDLKGLTHAWEEEEESGGGIRE